MLKNIELTRLEESLDHVRMAPADGGTVELIAARPAVDQRAVLSEARLDTRDGLEGDTWRARGSSRTPDGSANPDAQLTLMNARVAAAIAGDREQWPLAGDQLYVDLDLSLANLPPGSRVQIRLRGDRVQRASAHRLREVLSPLRQRCAEVRQLSGGS